MAVQEQAVQVRFVEEFLDGDSVRVLLRVLRPGDDRLELAAVDGYGAVVLVLYSYCKDSISGPLCSNRVYGYEVKEFGKPENAWRILLNDINYLLRAYDDYIEVLDRVRRGEETLSRLHEAKEPLDRYVKRLEYTSRQALKKLSDLGLYKPLYPPGGDDYA